MTPAWWQAALACRCPRCGKAPLFAGALTVQDVCPVCGLDLRSHDTGDGAATLLIFVVGAIVVGMAFWVEFHLNPPLWVHAILWPLVTIPLTLALMRPFKAGLVALHYRHRGAGQQE